MKTISLKVDERMDQEIDYTAERMGVTRSNMVREAVAVYIASGKVGRGKSCLDLAGDIIGCSEGPADLSTDSKYLDGFGE
jgi:hypothetical protein